MVKPAQQLPTEEWPRSECIGWWLALARILVHNIIFPVLNEVVMQYVYQILHNVQTRYQVHTYFQAASRFESRALSYFTSAFVDHDGDVS